MYANSEHANLLNAARLCRQMYMANRGKLCRWEWLFFARDNLRKAANIRRWQATGALK